ncbi:MAG: phosphoglycolate phosphatase [Gammaproteobacteria bacterium]|nr:phosphoglycolate phosphatase [Gammaproteobacteria bacterium]
MLTASNNSHPASLEPGDAVAFDRIRLILFDLDGTLVDSVPDLAWCGNEMLRRLDLPERDMNSARAWVGNGVERFVKRFLSGEMDAEPDEELFASGLDLFNRLYVDNVSERSQVYPGVTECLQQLAGGDLHLACVTNKPEPFTSDLIAAMGLAPYFELVVAGDTTARKKPDPMPLHYAADHFGLDYAECMMVGDSSNDVRAARAAGFAIACVPYGYNHGNDIGESRPDLIVENLIELAAMFA